MVLTGSSWDPSTPILHPNILHLMFNRNILVTLAIDTPNSTPKSVEFGVSSVYLLSPHD